MKEIDKNGKLGTFALEPSMTNEVCYLRLPTAPKAGTPGVVKMTLRLSDYLSPYDGPDINFDFDERGVMIGIEVIY